MAVGGYALQFAAQASGRDASAPENFTVAFALVAALSALSVLMMWRLPAHAGAQMAGRAQPGGQPPGGVPEQRPAT